MFNWIGDAIDWMGEKIGGAVEGVGSAISEAVWDIMLEWLYSTVFGAISKFFTMINDMGAEIFDLAWVGAFLKLFSYFGWTMFATGLIVAVFDVAIEYQTGRANIKMTAINVLKGFMAVSMFTTVPVSLYRFCVSLQNMFSDDLIRSFTGSMSTDIGSTAQIALQTMMGVDSLFGLLTMIALGYCVVKIFFSNIKRGGILLCQIAVGSLYMFSIPRGYTDGFTAWMKQVIALCLTSFLQTTLLFLGLLTWQTNMLLGLGIMLSANEVPRIAQQFGLDTSVKVNMMSVTHSVNTAVSAGRFVAKKLA